MVTKNELIEAKKELLELSEKNKGSIILKGENPILLIANIINDVDVPKINWVSRLTRDDNTFASLVYLLNKVSGCHAIINQVDVNRGVEDFHEYSEKEQSLHSRQLINKSQIREYIAQNGIDALINHLIWYESYHRDLEVNESNSSFIFGGLSGFAFTFKDTAEKHGITTQLGFGTTPPVEEFSKYGYKFTDDVIRCYSKLISLGLLQDKLLDRKQMWPRSLEIIGTSSFKEDFDRLATLVNAESDFINRVLEELREKGPYNALNPQVYQKKN